MLEALAIGQSHEFDTRVVLFVRLKDGVELDEALKKRIKQPIKSGATPRHLPALGIEPGHRIAVHDQLGPGHTYAWGEHNYVRLDPQWEPAHLFVVRSA